MALDLTVAVQLGGLLPFAHDFEPHDASLPYRQRRQVAVRAEEADTLGSVLARAMDELGITLDAEVRSWGAFEGGPVDALTFIDFYDPEHEHGIRRHGWRYDVTTVHEDGRTWWGQDFRAATIADLIRSSEAGFLDGDPTRPYLVLAPAAGNGPMLTWSEILAGLLLAERVLTALSSMEGVAGLVERLRRTNRARDATEEVYLDLEERGANPGNFRGSLGEGPWSSTDLAGYLACSVERAEGLLEGYGFTHAESGLWRLGDDPDSRFMNDVQEEIAYSRSGSERGALQPEIVLRDRLGQLARTGERPPIPELEGLPDFDSMSEEEIEAWSREQDEDSEDMASDEENDLLGGEERALATPYEQIQVRCACGRPDCDARIEFERVGERLRLRLLDPRDHFEIDADFLGRIALQVSVENEHEQAAE